MLERFLSNPSVEIRMTDSDTVSELQERLKTLEVENKRLEFLYTSECTINMRLQDILSEHGISFRSRQ